MYYEKFTDSIDATQHITLDIKLLMGMSQQYAVNKLLAIYCLEDLLNQKNHFSLI